MAGRGQRAVDAAAAAARSEKAEQIAEEVADAAPGANKLNMRPAAVALGGAPSETPETIDARRRVGRLVGRVAHKLFRGTSGSAIPPEGPTNQDMRDEHPCGNSTAKIASLTPGDLENDNAALGALGSSWKTRLD